MSPGPAYGPEDLIRLTTWEDATLAREEALRLVAVAQPHVITMSRAPHHSLNATLAREGDLWRFHAEGTSTNGTLDEYEVLITEGEAPRAVSDEVQPPRSLVEGAFAVMEREASMRAFLDGSPTFLRATWDAQTASCVTLHYAGGERVVVNLVQGRVVFRE